MKSISGLLLRVGVFAAAMALLLFGVSRTIERPLSGGTSHYTAVFTDANGLKSGDDIRMFGVRIGTVSKLVLKDARAEVSLTVLRDHPIYDNTKFAVRYQNLAGQRYIDVQQPDGPGTQRHSGEVIGPEHTVPSFDITTLFNGLQPVLAELSPADLNHFGESLLAVVQGDGTGIGPAFDAIQKLSAYTVDRQQVISALVNNISAVSEQIGGRSGAATALVTQLTALFTTLAEKLGGLVDFGLTIPPVLVPALDLLNQIGLDGDPNPNLTATLNAAFPDRAQASDVLKSLPALLQSLAAAVPHAGADLSCSHGSLPTPAPFQILIAGQGVSLCNP